MPLTQQFIRQCSDDEALFKALSAELCRRMPPELEWDRDDLMARMRACPPGLRAMAAVYQLDVSMTLDDFGWHFGNWHHRAYCEETLRGLRELGAHEAAEIFQAAYALVQPYWDRIGELLQQDFDEFAKWYRGSDLEKALDPLNRRMWDFCKRTKFGLLDYWVPYARKYPGKVASAAKP